MKDKIFKQLQLIEGKVGFYYKNLVTKETICYQDEVPMEAASVIKIPILIEAFNQINKGTVDKKRKFTICQEDKLPSCGALTYMHDGLEVTFKDLYTLMIILSDNTASNLVIKELGMSNINKTMQDLGLEHTKINRLLFDAKQSALGVENYISACEIGGLLEKMYHEELISLEASKEMIQLLKNQRLNGKIPFYLPGSVPIAHKTGEDDGITHDVAIVYAPEPFVVCFCGNEVEVPLYERLMQDISASLLRMQS